MPYEITTVKTPQENGMREGRVDKIRFRNEENGYSVLFVDVKGKRETWIGTMPHAVEGTTLRAEGTWEPNPKFGGMQFKVGNSEMPPPKGHEASIKTLSSLVPGVGPKTAEKILAAFGEEVWSVMETAPQRLREASIKGLPAAKADEMCRAWSGKKDLNRVLKWLRGHGLGDGLANRIIRTYGDRAMEVVTKQPYRLAMDIAGIGFTTADKIARNIGILLTDPERIMAGILYVLEKDFVDSGHCYAWDTDLVAKATAELKVGSSVVAEGLGRLERSGRVKTEVDAIGEARQTRVFPRRLFDTEEKVAWYLARLMRTPAQLKGVWCGGEAPKTMPLEQAVNEAIEESKSEGFTLSEAQTSAMKMLATEKVMVITGSPGTGKSSVVKCILRALKKAGATDEQAAPTGKAAKRIREITGEQASTIHSLLGFDPSSGKFIHNEENTLPIDVLLVDEVSMTDLMLTRHLLAALSPESRLILVGDVDQLPSVGAGAVLRDIITSECIPTVRLTQIFRQAAQSSIITNSHAINNGKMPTNDVGKGENTEFVILPAENVDDINGRVVQIVTQIIPQQYKIDAREVQVLCPKKDGQGGVHECNAALQKALNPNGRGYRRGEVEFRVGDRVIHGKNDYARRVFNGDVGYVVDVFQEGARVKPAEGQPEEKKKNASNDPVLRVRYDDDVIVDYTAKQTYDLMLAYACTVHRMQGSENKAIVMPVLARQFIMLSRNLVYTGVTRAKRLVVLLAEQKAMKIALAETRKEQRNTRLAERIRQAMKSSL